MKTFQGKEISFKRILARNANALLLNGVLLGIGYCFGGRIGIGVVLVFILLVNLFG